MRVGIQASFWALTTASLVNASPPNVVMIISDDQAWSDYSFMGHPQIRTPHIDKLAEESLTFRHGYVPSSLCRPSLATMITGLYPHQHKITSNDPPLPRGPKFEALRDEMIAYIDRAPTLPKLLGTKGYLSHQSGKWWEGNHCRCGFTDGMTHGDPERGGRHGDEGLKIGRQGLGPVTEFIDQAVETNKPFYVWYAPFMPHTPHNPPEHLLQKYKDKTPSIHVARYWAMCEWFDETVGELVGHLDEKGLRDNTIVVYVCDNGWIQNPEKPDYAPRSKRSPHEGGIRTPIMVRWPNKIKPHTSDVPVNSVDLAPTILKAAGVEVPPEMRGIDLTDAEAVRGRDAVFGAIFTHNAIDIHDPSANLQYRWCVSNGWKLILPAAWNEPKAEVELYHLREDPTEQTNLARHDPDRVRELSDKIDEWWTPHRVNFAPQTGVGLKDGRWHINDKITYPGAPAEGLLMNVRMVNSTFEDRAKAGFDPDENTDRFLERLHEYAKHGVRGITLCLQGGMPGYEGAVNSAFEPDGTLRPDYMDRVGRVIAACDREGVVAILGCYYQRQDQTLKDEVAVRRGVVNVCEWVRTHGFTNVVLEVANEFPHPGFDHEILRSAEGQAELIRLAKRTNPGLLVSSSGLGRGLLPKPVADASDFLLIHFNSTPVEQIPARIRALKKYGKAIVCNEDDKVGEAAARAAQACVENGASWGLMLNELNQYHPFIYEGAKDDPVVYAKLKQLTGSE